ncbi:alpha-ketoacid dehydrogenase subunit beta [Pelagerythrobacter marensis]|uniref:Pyruvate dehydrogenase E1 component subunit beta n=1 Tax=Pelagerythrobacter marensis TaxID=543877 RepID=A0A0G3XAS4_9SPHN|nr:alpha-ketoacid dehydrogenase subunit beta [Pelagerythrobacter marensis]AKM07726.1 Pyruvate dehydrogenase E1 component subunit beta [Pelagerythrobacter marensis]
MTLANSTTRLSYLQAIVEAQREEMRRDENVILMGEDIAVYGAQSLFDEFDASRLRNTPISENSFVGVGVGAALTGLRPIVDLTIASFCYLASDQLINQAAKLRFMTGGQLSVPLVVRTSTFYNNRTAAQHADRPYPLFMNTPGLKVLAPATASDAKGLLKAAVRDDDPVVIFEDINLWNKKEDVPVDADVLVPIGKAAVRREGNDVTIVSIAGCLPHAMKAADDLAGRGISAEVIDIRTIAPLDSTTILSSVAKTGRLVIADNSHRVGSVASEIAAVVCEEAFDALKRPVRRVTAPQVHVPYNGALEKGLFVTRDKIVAAVEKLN